MNDTQKIFCSYIGRKFDTQCAVCCSGTQSISYPGRATVSRETDPPPTTTGFSGHNAGC